jgi:sugar lactone lactonase YvrE
MLDSIPSLLLAGLLGSVLAATVSAQSGGPSTEFIIETIAGTGGHGYAGDGGPALDATFAEPASIAVDAQGNVYIADTDNSVIRKITISGIVSTVVGNGTAGFGGDFGPAIAAELNHPFSIVLDAAGDIYIADSFNNRIRKVSPGGTITTCAGNGTAGFSGDNGPAFQAEMNNPFGVGLDPAGNLYIADVNNQRVRKVTPSGTITTIAGNGTIGYSGDGGPATSASLAHPGTVASDASGILYIVDSGNHAIRKVDSGGTITTVAGRGISNGGLVYPTDVAVDSSGDLFITDPDAAAVYQVRPNGSMTRIAGAGYFGHSGDGGPAVLAALSSPTGLAIGPTGIMYFTDEEYIRTLTLEPDPIADTPTISLASGSYSGLQYATLSDNTPNAVIRYTLDGSTPAAASPGFSIPIYIGGSITLKAVAMATAYANSAVASATYEVTLPSAAPPTFSPPPGRYTGPVSVSIGDTTPGAVIHFTLDGSTPLSSSPVYTGALTLPGSTTVKAIATASGFWKSADVAAAYSVIPQAPTPVISPESGYYPVSQLVTITDADTTATIRYTTDGSTPSPMSTYYSKPFPLAGATTIKAIAIATGEAASEVATDSFLLLPGIITTVAGVGASGYGKDGILATNTQLNGPEGVALSPAGNLYIADTGSSHIREVNSQGIISTVAGSKGSGHASDGGPATLATLNRPSGVAFDAQGDMYIADLNNNEVRKVDTSGVITTVAGTEIGGNNGSYGKGTEIQLDGPTNVAVDKLGNLYISDLGNYRICKVDTSGTLSTIIGFVPPADQFEPWGVAVDSVGNVFIADTSANTILKLDTKGNLTTIAGTGAEGFSGDGGPATLAQLLHPYDVAVDASGNVYFSDGGNGRIREIFTDGVITTVAGGGSSGLGDGGSALNAELSNPWGIAVDAAGDIYIAEAGDSRIRKVTPAIVP